MIFFHLTSWCLFDLNIALHYFWQKWDFSKAGTRENVRLDIMRIWNSVIHIFNIHKGWVKQAAKVSRVDHNISKSSTSYPQVIFKSSDPIWSNLKGFIGCL